MGERVISEYENSKWKSEAYLIKSKRNSVTKAERATK